MKKGRSPGSARRSAKNPVSARPIATALVRPDATLAPSNSRELPGSSYAGGEIELHLRQLCDATRMTPEGPVPDWPTRAKGLQLLLAYHEGLPRPRKDEMPRSGDTNADVESRLKTQPKLRQAFRNYLDHLDGGPPQESQESLGDAVELV